MSRRARPGGPSLFDLPLRSGRPKSETEEEPERERQASLFLDPPDEDDLADRTLRENVGELLSEGEEDLDSPEDEPRAEGPRDVADRTLIERIDHEELEDEGFGDDEESDEGVSLGSRFLAGLVDLGVQVLMLGAAVFGAWRLGVAPRWDEWAPFAVLGFVFSFLYWFIPLAFWGRTPGMAWTGQIARSLDDEPLSFAQTTLRWLGALLTTAFAGLPLLLALVRGRSLTDLMSDTKTARI